MKIIKIKLGDKLFNEIKEYLKGLPLDNVEGKANELMHIIARNEVPKEELQEIASQKVDDLGTLIMSEAHEIGEMHRKNKEPAGTVE